MLKASPIFQQQQSSLKKQTDFVFEVGAVAKKNLQDLVSPDQTDLSADSGLKLSRSSIID
jgi:hypothetical protein